MNYLRDLMNACLLNSFSILWFVSSLANAQFDSSASASDTLRRDLLLSKPFNRLPSDTDNGAFHTAKSSMLAVGLSAVFPGAGQVYNENYWKVPVIWGLGGYWIYEWFKLNDKYQDYRSRYLRSLEEIPLYGNKKLMDIRDFYRDERDKFAWYLGALYFLNLVDAYVGANLYDFDVSPDLTVDGKIVPKVSVAVKYRF